MVTYRSLDGGSQIFDANALLDPQQYALVEPIIAIARFPSRRISSHAGLKIEMLHRGQVKHLGHQFFGLIRVCLLGLPRKRR
ncbi:hypothetical protein RRF57_011648 [Xylaria bambusicola]|uniref:Uncharacterized protein n=1 Tax=Xylaria bambusicola TaxID=326684 RepID=A0AAN7UZT5_9PEZI